MGGIGDERALRLQCYLEAPKEVVQRLDERLDLGGNLTLKANRFACVK